MYEFIKLSKYNRGDIMQAFTEIEERKIIHSIIYWAYILVTLKIINI